MADYRGRRWCITINNFTPEDEENIFNVIEYGSVCGIAEHEWGLENTGHIQAYIEFKNPQRLAGLKRLISQRLHAEPARGSYDQNIAYCSKEGTVFALKTKKEKGESTNSKENWTQIVTDAEEMSKEEFKTAYPRIWFLYREKVEKIHIDSAMEQVSDFSGELKVKNVWLWGEPGVGKSRWAASHFDYKNTYKKNFNKWWDGYSLLETKIVILEDYPPNPQGSILAQHMKVWADRYPFLAECKNSHMLVEPKRFFFIVTSNYKIEDCFQNYEDVQALKRRFTQIEVKSGDLYSQCVIPLDKTVIGFMDDN